MNTKNLVSDEFLQRFINDWIADEHIINKYGHPNQFDRSEQIDIMFDIISPKDEDGNYIGEDDYIDLDRYHGEETYYDDGDQSTDADAETN